MRSDPYFEKYCLVDISPHANLDLVKRLNASLPDLVVEPVNGNYNEELENLLPPDQPVLLLFLGSNIGNFRSEQMEWLMKNFEIGRASCRERVKMWEVDGWLKKKN